MSTATITYHELPSSSFWQPEEQPIQMAVPPVKNEEVVEANFPKSMRVK